MVESFEIQTLVDERWSSAKSQAEFTSSHNRLSYFSISVCLLFVLLFVLLFFCFYLVQARFSVLFMQCFSNLPFLFLFLFIWRSCNHVCSLWDKKNNPEPWNKLDPTYQYKVTNPVSEGKLYQSE